MALAKAQEVFSHIGLSMWDLMDKICLEIGSGDCFLGHTCKAFGITLISLDKEPGGFPGSRSYEAEVPFVKADATKLPFPASHFDLVISHWAPPTVCLPTIQEIRTCCKEVMRVLKDGGEFRFGPDLLAGKYFQAMRVTREEKERLVENMDDQSIIAVRKKSRDILRSIFPLITFSHEPTVDNVDRFCVVRKQDTPNVLVVDAG